MASPVCNSSHSQRANQWLRLERVYRCLASFSSPTEGRRLTVSRLQRLRPLIAEKGLDGLLVSQPKNCCYLSGFTGSSGWLLISDSYALLATDFRYTEQAKKETQDFEIIQIKGEPHNWLLDLISNLGWHKLGFEAEHLSFAAHHQLAETIKGKQLNLELIPTTNLAEHLRSIKEPEELELIMKAVELTDAAFEQAKAIIRPGVTEKEIAWEIEKFLRRNGSEGVPFEIIIASGPNSALPHSKPTERIICSGEPVLIDMGARVGSYCSDFSRTLCLGKPDKTLPEIYNIVLEAQLLAIDRIESGMTAAEADKLARSVIEQAGYGDNFGHGLGHGVGLTIHELPTLSATSSDLLGDGMVFTIEPGIYLTGYGGVRIEDMVTLEKGRAKVLTRSGKDSFQL
ncbi:MAG: M24 family metallopeptidase [Dehalococcoidia bacterium]|nr:M24 family metallopeptidase [Dehalococcoidia bacterium]